MRNLIKLRGSIANGLLGFRKCQLFATASTSPALNKTPLRPNRTKLEPGALTTQNIGQWYTIPVAHLEKLNYKKSLPCYYARQVDTLFECSIMVRRQFIDIMNCLNRLNPDSPTIRYVLYGAHGTGKSMALWQTVQWAHSNGWIVAHVPFARNWNRIRTEVTPSAWRPDRFDLPIVAQGWLTDFKKTNEHLLTEHRLTATKDFTWTQRENTPAGSRLMDIVDLGIARPKLASDCMGAVLRELKIHAKEKKVKFMAAIDMVNSFFVEAKYRRPDGTHMHASEISIIRHMLDLLSNDWNNGAVVTTVDSREIGDHTRPPYLPYHLLGQEGFEALDPFVPIQMSEYTEHEAYSCLDYYTEKNWIQRPAAKSEEGRKEIVHISTKNPWLLERTIASY